MKIKTKKLKTILGAVATQNDECTVRPGDTGWSIKTVDPSHVSMIFITVPAETFEGYTKTEPFALSLKNILKMLANAGEDTEITVTDGRFVVESDGLRSRFPLLTPEENDPRIPEIQYDSGAMLEAGQITRVSSATFGSVDAYTLTITEEAFSVAAEDETGNGATVTVPKDKCLDLKGAACSHFPIDMLDRFLKVLAKDTLIEVRLGTDLPVTVLVNDEGVDITYLLAPRIESE